MGSCSALVRRAWFCFRPRLRIRCQYKIRQRLLLEMAIWIKKKMYFVPPKVVVLVPSFKVFSMINNKVPYFLVQMLFKLHHLVCSFFFLPVFVHTWCILWCCDFVSDLPVLDAPFVEVYSACPCFMCKFAAGSVSDKYYWALNMVPLKQFLVVAALAHCCIACALHWWIIFLAFSGGLFWWFSQINKKRRCNDLE